MLPRKNRFNFKTGLPKKVIHSNSFSLRFGTSDAGMKVAIVVSKKVDSRATVRNRIKRKVVEIIRKSTNKDFPFNLVYYIKKAALSSPDLEKEIKEGLGKIVA